MGLEDRCSVAPLGCEVQALLANARLSPPHHLHSSTTHSSTPTCESQKPQAHSESQRSRKHCWQAHSYHKNKPSYHHITVIPTALCDPHAPADTTPAVQLGVTGGRRWPAQDSVPQLPLQDDPQTCGKYDPMLRGRCATCAVGAVGVGQSRAALRCR